MAIQSKDPTRILRPGVYTVRSENSLLYFCIEIEQDGTCHQLTPDLARDGVLRSDGWSPNQELIFTQVEESLVEKARSSGREYSSSCANTNRVIDLSSYRASKE